MMARSAVEYVYTSETEETPKRPDGKSVSGIAKFLFVEFRT
jgi:hypothetical protein